MKAKKKGWPFWLYLAFLSIVFYLLLVIWFVKTLDGDLKSRLAASTTTDASVAAAIPQYFLKQQPSSSQPQGTVDVAKDDMTIPKPKQQSNLPHIPPRPKKRKEATAKTTTSGITKGHTGTLFYGFDRNDVESYLKQHGPAKLRQTIGAFLEPETSFVVPGTVNQGLVDQDEDPGLPPQFIEPLPLRTFTPDDLKHFEYPKFQTCHDLPAKLPVDRGLELDATTGEPIVWNVGNEETPPNYVWDQAPYCPVDADPFLPWIHDVFPSVDGTVLEFIAHNRRRCKTGRKHRPDVLRLEPQVALLQHVSVERITPAQAQTLAPELWNSKDEDSSTTTTAPTFQQYRYRLAPMNESSPDGQFTRFLCRFHGTVLQQGNPQSVIIDETLSVFPYNYEFVSYRKGKPTMITPKGKDNRYFWTSVLRFQCPIPKSLQDSVRKGETILSDGTPTLHVDLIPIRTPPRFGVDDMYLPEDMIGPRATWTARDWHNWRNDSALPAEGFDAYRRWGNKNVLPRVEASGRWTNLPICQPPELPQDDKDQDKNQKIVAFQEANVKERGTTKPHLLSACVWASASFKTRGKGQGKDPILDTGTRLREWIEFHLMVGFDHIYVFDNSGAQTNATSLKPILDQYPKSQISRIEWPSIICNNNIPAHDSTGERSSQYTAENACRTRFAPFSEWIAAFDTDEYLIPAGTYTSLRDVIRNASKKKKTNILTFRSSRARLLYERSMDAKNADYREMMSNQTYLEAYNCDSSPIPKPEWADRARKQIYRADYVPYHYVHYSTVTAGLLTEYKNNTKWKKDYTEFTERVTDEANEAIMLHTKTTTAEQTSRWKKRCHYKFDKKWRGCYVGFAWPNGKEDPSNSHRKEDGYEYNCFQNERVDNYWIPRLKEALAKRMQLVSQ